MPTNETKQSVTVLISETKGRRGEYIAVLHPENLVLCISKMPLANSARVLAALGYQLDTEIIMKTAESGTVSIISTVSTAAKLTVEETIYGPRFRTWKPFSFDDKISLARRITLTA